MPDGLWVDDDIFMCKGKYSKEGDEIDVYLWNYWLGLMPGLLSCFAAGNMLRISGKKNNAWVVPGTWGQKGEDNRIWIKRKNWLANSDY